MKKRKPVPEDSWFKRKSYLHFDYALKKPEAVSYAKNPDKIAKHAFSPFIHYTKSSRRYKRDKETKELKATKKCRHIFYASHIDGYIYSYYASILYDKYETFLAKHGLVENIIAYRRIEKNGEKYSNINFACEAFDYIKSTSGCNVLCIDVSSFFDNLCMNKLKEKWCQILEKEKLPDAHYNVFWSLKKFHYVEENAAIHFFGKTPRKTKPRKKLTKEQRRIENDRCFGEKICEYAELRKLNHLLPLDNKLIRSKSKFEITGIPQGSPISGLLSNIFMIDFDLAIKAFVEKIGGFYRRYSDDILIAFPSSVQLTDVLDFVVSTLAKASNNSLKINSSKTERRSYRITADGVPACLDEKEMPSRVQYLGFTFDGQQVHIRNSSISKNKAKIAYLVRRHKKPSGAAINTREVYKAQSHRKITPYNQGNKKGFINYARRAKNILNAEGIIRQAKKNDRFIKKKIKETTSKNTS